MTGFKTTMSLAAVTDNRIAALVQIAQETRMIPAPPAASAPVSRRRASALDPLA